MAKRARIYKTIGMLRYNRPVPAQLVLTTKCFFEQPEKRAALARCQKRPAATNQPETAGYTCSAASNKADLQIGFITIDYVARRFSQ